MVSFDDSLQVLPVPFLIVERVHGVDLETVGPAALGHRDAWRDLGRDLAVLHGHGRVGPLTGVLINDPPKFPDPRQLVEERVSDGWLSAAEATWLVRWLDRIATEATRPRPARLLHGDVQMSNVLLDAASLEFRALIGAVLKAMRPSSTSWRSRSRSYPLSSTATGRARTQPMRIWKLASCGGGCR